MFGVAPAGGASILLVSSPFTVPAMPSAFPEPPLLTDLAVCHTQADRLHVFFLVGETQLVREDLVIKIPLPLGGRYRFPRRVIRELRWLSSAGKRR